MNALVQRIVVSGEATESPMIKNCVQALEMADEGMSFTFKDYAELLGVDSNDPRLRLYILKVNGILAQRKGMEMVSITGIGYKVASPEECLGKARNYRRHMINKGKRQLLVCSNTKRSRLGDEDRRELESLEKKTQFNVAFMIHTEGSDSVEGNMSVTLLSMEKKSPKLFGTRSATRFNTTNDKRQ